MLWHTSIVPYSLLLNAPIFSCIFFNLVGKKQEMQVDVEHQKATNLPRGEKTKKKKIKNNLFFFFFLRSFQEKQKLQLNFTKHT